MRKYIVKNLSHKHNIIGSRGTTFDAAVCVAEFDLMTHDSCSTILSFHKQ